MTDGGVLYLESGISQHIRDGLAARGHRIQETGGYFGGYQAVKREGNVFIGATEIRKEGRAEGVNANQLLPSAREAKPSN